jgi:endo-1,4-beta-xylanase
MTKKLRIIPASLLLFIVGCSGGGEEPNSDPDGTGGDAAGSGGSGGPGSGGSSNTGGGANSGGSTNTGGGANSGGSNTGGGANSGGSNTGGGQSTGGASNSGGDTGSGGDSSSGGAPGSGGQSSTCTDPEGQVCSSYQVGQHCGLTFEIWTDSAEACMTNTATGFRAMWDAGDGNYLARKGVRPGSDAPIVTYSSDYNPGNNNTYLGVYGWTTDPLIEYYIIENFGSYDPSSNAEQFGEVQADGGTYKIYRTERVNQPSIEGNTTFWQYWSVRTEKRTSGTVTVKPHFDAWAASGLELGDFYEVSMLVEGYHSSGNVNVNVTFE